MPATSAKDGGPRGDERRPAADPRSPRQNPAAPEPRRDPDLSNFTQGPGGQMIDREQLAEVRRRADRSTGIMLLVIGIGATIASMLMLTENALAQQYATLAAQYHVEPYRRPAGLGALAAAGIIGHPVIYAATLYLTLLRWRAGKRALWIIILGAVLGAAFSFAIVSIGLAMHPDLLAAASATGQ